jgi:hypothetical protein
MLQEEKENIGGTQKPPTSSTALAGGFCATIQHGKWNFTEVFQIHYRDLIKCFRIDDELSLI